MITPRLCNDDRAVNQEDSSVPDKAGLTARAIWIERVAARVSNLLWWNVIAATVVVLDDTQLSSALLKHHWVSFAVACVCVWQSWCWFNKDKMMNSGYNDSGSDSDIKDDDSKDDSDNDG